MTIDQYTTFEKSFQFKRSTHVFGDYHNAVTGIVALYIGIDFFDNEETDEIKG